MISIHTIGFTEKSAEEFFEALKSARIALVADVRLNNTSQLAGFTKKKDLAYFLGLLGVAYEHWEQFAPTKELMKKYREDKNWAEYEKEYRRIIAERGALDNLDTSLFGNKRICLLCSEATAENCHRRLAAEMIAQRVCDMEILHL